MLSTHPQDRSVAADRTQEILDRLALEVEKAGNSYGLHPDARRMVRDLADHGGFFRAAASIRRTIARLDGPDLHAAPAPRPGTVPRPTPPRPPILVALDGGGEEVPVVEDLQVLAELQVTLAALAARRITPELRDDLAAAIAGLDPQSAPRRPRGA